LIATREGVVEKLGHRAAGPILVEDLLGHEALRPVGGVDKDSPADRTQNTLFAAVWERLFVFD
jgi:hypothetical protein